MKLSVREMTTDDIEQIVNYFCTADVLYLKGMGADKHKLPEKGQWIKKLQSEYAKPYNQKEFYYIIWLIDNQPIGHSNINKITYGISASMHLHIWKTSNRRNGFGVKFLNLTIPYYFDNFKLKNLICEPYAENPAPNYILKKIGFTFEKSYETTPGWINFYQMTNQFTLSKEKFNQQK